VDGQIFGPGEPLDLRAGPLEVRLERLELARSPQQLEHPARGQDHDGHQSDQQNSRHEC
jgi:hypothetical protein